MYKFVNSSKSEGISKNIVYIQNDKYSQFTLRKGEGSEENKQINRHKKTKVNRWKKKKNKRKKEKKKERKNRLKKQNN